MMEQRACRSDRIGAEEHVDAGELAAGDETERQRFRACDGTIKARLGGRWGDVVLFERSTHFRGLAISVASVQSRNIGFG